MATLAPKKCDHRLFSNQADGMPIAMNSYESIRLSLIADFSVFPLNDTSAEHFRSPSQREREREREREKTVSLLQVYGDAVTSPRHVAMLARSVFRRRSMYARKEKRKTGA
jgi:hypothetical protein